jgi:hypothetical protein
VQRVTDAEIAAQPESGRAMHAVFRCFRLDRFMGRFVLGMAATGDKHVVAALLKAESGLQYRLCRPGPPPVAV